MYLNYASLNNQKKVEGMVKLCIRLLKKKEYEMEMDSNSISFAIDRLIVIDDATKRSCANAGVILINVGAWWRKKGIHPEYKRFEKDPVIGTLRGIDPDHALMALVAHEVAHHVQFKYAPKVNRSCKNRFVDWQKPHGDTFQTIYRHLRRDLVNPMINAASMSEAA